MVQSSGCPLAPMIEYAPADLRQDFIDLLQDSQFDRTRTFLSMTESPEALNSRPFGKRRLGRGLNALLGGDPAEEQTAETAPGQTAEVGDSREIEVGRIERNPHQPRKVFAEESLEELASSIRQHGVLQPLLVQPHEDHFQLIAGERRLLAARKAGLPTVPCIIRVVEDQRQVSEIAIEENIKRQDLNDLEKAQAFRDYIDQFGTTVEQLAKKLSMNRATVSNTLRLLDLSEPVKAALSAGKLSAGHGRALLPLDADDQQALAGRIQMEQLSVRQTEQAVRQIQKGEATIPLERKPKPAPPERTSHIDSLQAQLRDMLGVKVEIQLTDKDRGKIQISFDSNDEFEQILRRLRRAAA